MKEPFVPNFDYALYRRDVKGDVRRCVLFLALAFAVNYIVMEVVIIAYGIGDVLREIMPGGGPGAGGLNGGEAGTGALGVVQDVMSSLGGEAVSVSTIAGAVCGGMMLAILRKRRFFADLAMPVRERMAPRLFVCMAVLMLMVQCVSSLIITFVDKLLSPFGISIAETYSENAQLLMNAPGIAYIVLIGPVIEELVFRGAALGTLRKYGDNFAIVISALLFGFYHMMWAQIPYAFVVGLLLGYAAIRWSMRASIALHIINNAISVLASMPSMQGETAQSAIGFALFACAIAGAIWLIARRRSLVARVRAGASYYAGAFRFGLTSIPLIVYFALTALVGCLTLTLGI